MEREAIPIMFCACFATVLDAFFDIEKLRSSPRALHHWRGGIITLPADLAANPFPYLQSMHRNIGIDVETELHFVAFNLEHLDFQNAMKTIDPSDDDRLVDLSHQDQYRRISLRHT
jgi:hypothetical protein